jgi:hypothetical protein
MLVREKGLDKRVYDENDEIDEGKQEITLRLSVNYTCIQEWL